MRKTLFILFSIILIGGFNYQICAAEEMGRIIGKSIIYGKLVKIDYQNNTVTIEDEGGSVKSFLIIGKGTEFLGRDIKIGSYLELVVLTSLEGQRKLLSIMRLEAKPDFTNHPD